MFKLFLHLLCWQTFHLVAHWQGKRRLRSDQERVLLQRKDETLEHTYQL